MRYTLLVLVLLGGCESAADKATRLRSEIALGRLKVERYTFVRDSVAHVMATNPRDTVARPAFEEANRSLAAAELQVRDAQAALAALIGP